MAVVSSSSTVITNRDASPKVLSNARLVKGAMMEAAGLVAAVSGDSIASKYKFFSLPSNARVSDLLLTCDAITTCAGDIGLYQTTANGGAVVDVDFFSAAKSLAAALKRATVCGDNVMVAAQSEKPLWEALGLSTDPKIDYDVVVTLTAAAGSAGNIFLQAQFAI